MDQRTPARFADRVDFKGPVYIDGSKLDATELQYLDGLTAGTVTASKAVVVDASKNISSFGTLGATTVSATSVNATNVDAGASGTAGTVDVFPTTASKGKNAHTATDNTGNTTNTFTNAAMAGARTFTTEDPNVASASYLTNSLFKRYRLEWIAGINGLPQLHATIDNPGLKQTVIAGGSAGDRPEPPARRC